MAVILFHPTLLARRAAEIARRQGATKLEQDACGRPFVRGADPLAQDALVAQAQTIAMVVAKAIHAQKLWVRLVRAMAREAGPRIGQPVERQG